MVIISFTQADIDGHKQKIEALDKSIMHLIERKQWHIKQIKELRKREPR